MKELNTETEIFCELDLKPSREKFIEMFLK